eukprot:Lankesteria_metandrocarpae@DN2151_c0_g1_i1.p1
MNREDSSDDIRPLGRGTLPLATGSSSSGKFTTTGDAVVSGGPSLGESSSSNYQNRDESAIGGGSRSGGRTHGFKSESDASCDHAFSKERTSSFHDTLAGFRKMDRARGSNCDMLARMKSGKLTSTSTSSTQDIHRPLMNPKPLSSCTGAACSSMGAATRARGGALHTAQSPTTPNKRDPSSHTETNYLTTQVEYLRQECDALKLENKQLKASKYKTDTLKKTLVSTEEENSRLSRDVARLNARINTVQKDAQVELQSLRNQLQALQQNEKALRLRIKQSSISERDTMEVYEEYVAEELKALRSANDQLSDELEEMRLCLCAARDEIQRRRSEAERYEVEKEMSLRQQGRRDSVDSSPPDSPKIEFTSSVMQKKEIVDLRTSVAESSAFISSLREDHSTAIREEREIANELRSQICCLSKTVDAALTDAADSKQALAEFIISNRNSAKQLGVHATDSDSSSVTVATTTSSDIHREDQADSKIETAIRRECILTELSSSLFNICKRLIELQVHFSDSLQPDYIFEGICSTTATPTTGDGGATLDNSSSSSGDVLSASVDTAVTKSYLDFLRAVRSVVIDDEIAAALETTTTTTTADSRSSDSSPAGSTGTQDDRTAMVTASSSMVVLLGRT